MQNSSSNWNVKLKRPSEYIQSLEVTVTDGLVLQSSNH